MVGVIGDASNYLGRYFNELDFTQFELDEPFPDLGDFGRNGWESITDRLAALPPKYSGVIEA